LAISSFKQNTIIRFFKFSGFIIEIFSGSNAFAVQSNDLGFERFFFFFKQESALKIPIGGFFETDTFTFAFNEQTSQAYGLNTSGGKTVCDFFPDQAERSE
jgi:hypothetical protein